MMKVEVKKMDNQNNGNNVPQNGGQPIAQGYNGQPVNTASTPMAVPTQQASAPITASISMDKESIKRYVGMGAGILLLIGAFVDLVGASGFGFSVSTNIWDSSPTLFKILYLVLCLVPIGTFFLKRGKHLSYLTAGYALSVALSSAVEDIDLKIGFWLIMLGSIAIIVLLVMEDLPELKSIFMKTAPAPMPKMQVTSVPQQGDATVAAPVTPTVQNVQVCKHCGQPRKNPQDQFCQSCGQKYE